MAGVSGNTLGFVAGEPGSRSNTDVHVRRHAAISVRIRCTDRGAKGFFAASGTKPGKIFGLRDSSRKKSQGFRGFLRGRLAEAPQMWSRNWLLAEE